MTNPTLKARYIGDTPIAMPHLVDHERPETAKATAEWEEGGRVGVNPHVLVNKGDVIPIDRYSATERADFEVVGAKRKPRKPRKPAVSPPATEAPPEKE
jgi:hypothetical protein